MYRRIGRKDLSLSIIPVAIGPYSHARIFNGLLFVSGQLPIEPESGEIISEEECKQMDQCLMNISSIANIFGTHINKTIKTTVLLTDMSNFGEINDTYSKYFTNPYPARACYQVAALPKGARVEVEAIIAL